jgi:hypothetical protein
MSASLPRFKYIDVYLIDSLAVELNKPENNDYIPIGELKQSGSMSKQLMMLSPTKISGGGKSKSRKIYKKSNKKTRSRN